MLTTTIALWQVAKWNLRNLSHDASVSPAHGASVKAQDGKRVKFVKGYMPTKLAEIDRRERNTLPPLLKAKREAAFNTLKNLHPRLSGGWDDITGVPRHLAMPDRYLTSPGRAGSNPVEAVKQFVDSRPDLFGHKSAAMVGTAARITRHDTARDTGMTTFVWQQEVNGVPVYQSTLKANVSRDNEVITIGGGFVDNPDFGELSEEKERISHISSPPVSAINAVATAAASVGVSVRSSQIKKGTRVEKTEKLQTYDAPGLISTYASLAWVPVTWSRLVLAWDVVVGTRSPSGYYRVLVDARNGGTILRYSLSAGAAPATYRVFADSSTFQPYDSPSPMGVPRMSAPSTTQPSVLTSNLITITALNMAASPNGWINDSINTTQGNNVSAQREQSALSNYKQGDLGISTDRPTAAANRTFSYLPNFGQSPLATPDNRNLSVAQLFYTTNWMHDRLWELGFDEEAGNFQAINFSGKGAGGDLLIADAQDGSGAQNADFWSPPHDGISPRLQMHLFTDPSVDRDSSLDNQMIIHEYAHGLSSRLTGANNVFNTAHAKGLGEGWSDFFALALLSRPEQDDIFGCYPFGSYSSYKYANRNWEPDVSQTQNYYFGLRRYPYSVNKFKNPLTLRDADSLKAVYNPNIPVSPIYRTRVASGVVAPTTTLGASAGYWAGIDHLRGEVWCTALWEVRSQLLAKYGAVNGNDRALKIVTEGLKLCGNDPDYVQARNGVVLADRQKYGADGAAAIWTGFARRGFGIRASVNHGDNLPPTNTLGYGTLTTITVNEESYDLIDHVTSIAVAPYDAPGASFFHSPSPPPPLNVVVGQIIDIYGAGLGSATAAEATFKVYNEGVGPSLATAQIIGYDYADPSGFSRVRILTPPVHGSNLWLMHENAYGHKLTAAVLNVSEPSLIDHATLLASEPSDSANFDEARPRQYMDVFGTYLGSSTEADASFVFKSVTGAGRAEAQVVAYEYQAPPTLSRVRIQMPDIQGQYELLFSNSRLFSQSLGLVRITETFSNAGEQLLAVFDSGAGAISEVDPSRVRPTATMPGTFTALPQTGSVWNGSYYVPEFTSLGQPPLGSAYNHFAQSGDGDGRRSQYIQVAQGTNGLCSGSSLDDFVFWGKRFDWIAETTTDAPLVPLPTVVAQVAPLKWFRNSGDGFCGVMIREVSTDPNGARFIAVGRDKSGSIKILYRGAPGLPATVIAAVNIRPEDMDGNLWFRIVRQSSTSTSSLFRISYASCLPDEQSPVALSASGSSGDWGWQRLASGSWHIPSDIGGATTEKDVFLNVPNTSSLQCGIVTACSSGDPVRGDFGIVDIRQSPCRVSEASAIPFGSPTTPVPGQWIVAEPSIVEPAFYVLSYGLGSLPNSELMIEKWVFDGNSWLKGSENPVIADPLIVDAGLALPNFSSGISLQGGRLTTLTFDKNTETRSDEMIYCVMSNQIVQIDPATGYCRRYAGYVMGVDAEPSIYPSTSPLNLIITSPTSLESNKAGDLYLIARLDNVNWIYSPFASDRAALWKISSGEETSATNHMLVFLTPPQGNLAANSIPAGPFGRYFSPGDGAIWNQVSGSSQNYGGILYPVYTVLAGVSGSIAGTSGVGHDGEGVRALPPGASSTVRLRANCVLVDRAGNFYIDDCDGSYSAVRCITRYDGLVRRYIGSPSSTGGTLSISPTAGPGTTALTAKEKKLLKSGISNLFVDCLGQLHFQEGGYHRWAK